MSNKEEESLVTKVEVAFTKGINDEVNNIIDNNNETDLSPLVAKLTVSYFVKEFLPLFSDPEKTSMLFTAWITVTGGLGGKIELYEDNTFSTHILTTPKLMLEKEDEAYFTNGYLVFSDKIRKIEASRVDLIAEASFELFDSIEETGFLDTNDTTKNEWNSFFDELLNYLENGKEQVTAVQEEVKKVNADTLDDEW